MANSCSMTPPLSSPSKSDTRRPEEAFQNSAVPCFNCGNRFILDCIARCDGYLRTEELKKILGDELLSERNFISLHGKILRTQYDILKHSKKVFSRTKSFYSLLKMTTEKQNIPGFIRTQESHIASNRQELMQFLQILKVALQKLLSCKNDIVLSSYDLKLFLFEVARDLKNLLLFVGRISQVPDFVLQKGSFSGGSMNNLGCYYLLHICLDLWWSSVEIFHLINAICLSKDLVINIALCSYLSQGSKSMFEQISLLILWDLCVISFKNYKEFSSDSLEISPFICPCIKELWILMIMIMDKRHYLYKDESFWSNFYYIACHIMKSKESSFQNIDKNDHSGDAFFLPFICISIESPAEFCLWMINHIAPLYEFDINGEHSQSKTAKSCYSILKYIIELTLISEIKSGKEKCLRNVLSLCLPLVKLWEPSGDILLPLTDYYLRFIDDTFALPGFEVRELTRMFKSSIDWIEHIKKILSHGNHFAISKNSFELYLHILGVQMSKSGMNNTLWRQLKGRIYSKFTPKRLRDLSEVGLQNCFSIFLVISYVAQIEEISGKMSEFIRIIEMGSTSKKRQLIVCKAMFAALVVCQEKNIDLEKISLRVVNIFNNVCSEYKEMSKNRSQKIDLQNLIFMYLESTLSIFESSSNLMLSEHVLIGQGFSALLPVCGTSALNSILEIILNLLTHFGNIINYQKDCVLCGPHHLNLLKSIFLYIFPFIENCVSERTPPTQISGIGAALTALVNQLSPKNSSIPHLIEIFKIFGTQKSTNSLIMCQYLCIIMNDHNLFESLQSQIADIHVLLIQSWMKCGISIAPPFGKMLELTKTLFHLTEFNCILPGICQISLSGEHDYLMIKTFRMFGEFYHNSFSLQEKTNLRQKLHLYFQSLPFQVTFIIKSNASSSLLHHVYKIIGHLFQYCSPLLYIKYKPGCILPLLLDTLLLPHISFPKDKDLILSLQSVIKDHLSLFLQGLAKLDYKDDPYVQRKFKDLIVHYICQYSFPDNPLLELGATAAVEKSPNSGFTLLCFIINVIKDNFLSKNISNSSYGIKYFSCILKLVDPEVKIVISNLLLPCLLEQLLLFDDNHISFLEELSKMVFMFIQKDVDLTRRKSILIPKVQSLIERYLPWSTTRVYKWLNYIMEKFPFLMPELIPYLTRTIESIEKKRGVGHDIVLRNGLKVLVNKQCKITDAHIQKKNLIGKVRL